jgi:hypothetical protein
MRQCDTSGQWSNVAGNYVSFCDVDALQKRLGAEGYAISIDEVPYEVQRGGNQMMRVRVGVRSAQESH